MTSFVLDRDRFAAWLRSHGNEIIGRACTSSQCPVATWMFHDLGYRHPAVTPKQILAYATPPDPPPPWVRDFIDAIDYKKDTGAVITADHALSVLESLPIPEPLITSHWP